MRRLGCVSVQMLAIVFKQIERVWRHWLGCLSGKGYINREKFDVLRQTWPLPKPMIFHNIKPSLRGSRVMPQSCSDTLITKEPDELIAHVRIYRADGWVTAFFTQSEQI